MWVYLKIVRLRACFHSRQWVYGRFGHFDLHHLLRAQGGGMHTDMGYWRKQATPNTSICSTDSGEAACRGENMEEKAVNIRAQPIRGLAFTPG